MRQDEFTVLYEAHARAIRAYIARSTGNAHLAADLLQETFLRFLERGKGSRVIADPRAFLFRIASNLIIDHWRRQGRETELEAVQEQLADPGGEPSEQVITADLVARVFDRLTERQRMLLWLVYAEGYDHREAADAMGISEDSVKVMVFRAKQRLRQLFGQTTQELQS